MVCSLPLLYLRFFLPGRQKHCFRRGNSRVTASRYVFQIVSPRLGFCNINKCSLERRFLRGMRTFGKGERTVFLVNLDPPQPVVERVCRWGRHRLHCTGRSAPFACPLREMRGAQACTCTRSHRHRHAHILATMSPL